MLTGPNCLPIHLQKFVSRQIVKAPTERSYENLPHKGGNSVVNPRKLPGCALISSLRTFESLTVGTQVTTTRGTAEGARVDHDRGGFG